MAAGMSGSQPVHQTSYGVLPGLVTKPNSLSHPPTRNTGLERLDAFLPTAGRGYANRRNTDYGPALIAAKCRFSLPISATAS